MLVEYAECKFWLCPASSPGAEQQHELALRETTMTAAAGGRCGSHLVLCDGCLTLQWKHAATGISWCHQHAVTNACVHVLLALLGQAARQRALYARAILMPEDVEVQGGRQPELITN